MFSCSQLSPLIELNVDYLQYLSYLIIIQPGKSVADIHDTSHWSILENTCSGKHTAAYVYHCRCCFWLRCSWLFLVHNLQKMIVSSPQHVTQISEFSVAMDLVGQETAYEYTKSGYIYMPSYYTIHQLIHNYKN